jgi:hypothetical protein
MKNWCWLIICVLSISLAAQPYNATLQEVTDWSGWSAIVVENGLISTVTVPAIGARVMQYNLGENQFIYRNTSLNGKTYTPANNGSWYNFGGFKNWPAPQNDPGRWGWPPPPTLDYGNYTTEILMNTADSVKIKVTSPIEEWLTPDLQFIRIMTVFKNSSRVRMEQFLVNHATSVQDWSVWDITQTIVHHPGKQDYDNFWVYFPLNPNSKFGSEGVSWSSNFGGKPKVLNYGEVAPGIFGVQYAREQKKVFADVPVGWICFADLDSEVAYIKTFDVVDGATYPDNGGIDQLYTSSAGDYFEVEVTGPIENIPANGGQIALTINWWAAKVKGPILSVNSVGAISQYLKIQGDVLTGNYGVFHVGKAKVLVLDADGQVLTESQELDVSPLQNFAPSESITLPANAERVELRVYSPDDTEIGILDGNTVINLTNIIEYHPEVATSCELFQNYPNPFNANTLISYQLAKESRIKLSILDALGREVDILANQVQKAGQYRFNWNADQLESGIYFIKLVVGDDTIIRKCLLIK